MMNDGEVVLHIHPSWLCVGKFVGREIWSNFGRILGADSCVIKLVLQDG